GVGKVADREHRFEDGLKTLIRAAARRVLHHQKLVIRCLLNLNEVRHLCNFLNFSEKLPYALATGKRLRHVLSLCSSGQPCSTGRRPSIEVPGRLSGKPPSSRLSGQPCQRLGLLGDSTLPDRLIHPCRSTAKAAIPGLPPRNHRF